MFTFVTKTVLISLSRALTRAVHSLTLFNGVLAGSAIAALAILVSIVVGRLNGQPVLTEIGITYALLYHLATLAILKHFRLGNLAFDLPEDVNKPRIRRF